MARYRRLPEIGGGRYPVWSRTRRMEAQRHSFVVTDISKISLDDGFQTPHTNLVTGLITPLPFPFIVPIKTMASSWSGKTLEASPIPPTIFFLPGKSLSPHRQGCRQPYLLPRSRQCQPE